MSQDWWVYILECGDKSLYTGIAVDVEERIAVHNLGKGSKYTRSHRPVKLAYSEKQLDHSAALKRELQLKKLTRTQKLHLIKAAAKSQSA